MKYTIRQGSIAAIMYINDEIGNEWDAIFMELGKPAEISRLKDQGAGARSLPLGVRAAVNRDFSIMFFLPVERRQACIDSRVPYVVEVPDEVA